MSGGMTGGVMRSRASECEGRPLLFQQSLKFALLQRPDFVHLHHEAHVAKLHSQGQYVLYAMHKKVETHIGSSAP